MYPELNLNGPMPIHEQITAWIRNNILNNTWQSGYKLMAEANLAIKLGVSRGTVRKAIETLIGEDLLQRIHGKGTFVKEALLFEQSAAGEITGFTSDLLRRGIPFTTEVPFFEVIEPPDEIAGLLNMSPNGKIFHMQRIRRIASRANILIENHINYDFCVGIENVNFSEHQLYKTLENDFNIAFTWARRTYMARVATARIAAYLNISQNAPVMYLEELYHNSNDVPVEYTRAWFNGDLFHITTQIKREDEIKGRPGFYR